MTQVARTAFSLRTRLGAVFTDRYELPHTAPSHPAVNNFLSGIANVFSVMVHETDGAVARNRARSWVRDYRNAAGTGGGPQIVVWPDGTVMSLVELPYKTTHGNFLSAKSIGVESGHGNDGRFGDNDIAPDLRAGHPPRHGWREISGDGEDIVGSTSAKYYRLLAPMPSTVTDFDSEVIVSPWTTANYITPARERPGVALAGQYNTLVNGGGTPPPVPTIMLFSEAQYRSWALLARYLSEAFLVPRNFPVLPHARRDRITADIFKRIVLADQNFDRIVNGLHGTYLGVNLAFMATDFTDPAQVPALNAHFAGANVAVGQIGAAIGYNNSALNLAWLRLFDFYRGFHGHGFSGNTLSGQDDHDCPGRLFDWHRFAREVWDWWWYPFDFDGAHAITSVPERAYRRADGRTALVEYFHYDPPDPYIARTAAPGGIQGPSSSPNTFRLEPNSRVYALSNGELVAARFPASGDVSMAFVLVRHEVWHLLDLGGIARMTGVGGTDAAHGGLADVGRLDYNVEPTTVYSLYMHLGRPEGMSFEQVSDHNPDWLNRTLIRKKECDLALPPTLVGNLAPALSPLPAADFTQPPGAGRRPTPIEGWRMDQRHYGTFLSALASSGVAVPPLQTRMDAFGSTPIRVILGDFLGMAGVIRRQGGVSTHGIRVEVFSPTLISSAFTVIIDQAGWNVPAGVTRPALRYQSEWARAPSAAEVPALTAIGVDPGLVQWWQVVALFQLWDVRMPPAAKLPLLGEVFHYQPVDFMQWINDLTWASEWSKYRIPGARPVAPQSRRV